jgi:hypothetical protein
MSMKAEGRERRKQDDQVSGSARLGIGHRPTRKIPDTPEQFLVNLLHMLRQSFSGAKLR